MNEIKVISEQEVLEKHFTIYGDIDNPLFLAKDVAEWIENKQPTQMVELVDDNEKLKCLVNTSGQNREMWFLTEDGLYEVLMQSRKPIAKQFKREVKKILHDIRRHGVYAMDNVIEKILDNPDFGIKILSQLKEERQKRKELEQRAEKDRPKVIFADAVTASKTSILIGELAKIMRQNGIGIGEKRLFEWLRSNGYLVKRKGTDYNAPTQRSMEMGLFEVKETAITHSHGNTTINKTTKVTGRGQQYFINRFLDKGLNVQSV